MRFISILLCCVLLSACVDRQSAEYVATPVVSDRMAHAEDWSQVFPMVYDGMQECIAYHESPPAVALDVHTTEGSSIITVIVQGSDGTLMECQAQAFGGGILQLAPMEDFDTRRKTRFTPVLAEEPKLKCYDNEPVKDTAGRLLGWLSYPSC